MSHSTPPTHKHLRLLSQHLIAISAAARHVDNRNGTISYVDEDGHVYVYYPSPNLKCVPLPTAAADVNPYRERAHSTVFSPIPCSLAHLTVYLVVCQKQADWMRMAETDRLVLTRSLPSFLFQKAPSSDGRLMVDLNANQRLVFK